MEACSTFHDRHKGLILRGATRPSIDTPQCTFVPLRPIRVDDSFPHVRIIYTDGVTICLNKHMHQINKPNTQEKRNKTTTSSSEGRNAVCVLVRPCSSPVVFLSSMIYELVYFDTGAQEGSGLFLEEIGFKRTTTML